MEELTPLLEKPVRRADLLEKAVRSHINAVRLLSKHRSEINVPMAETIFEALLGLLKESTVLRSERDRRLIQLACDYYCEHDEELHDYKCAHGFRDDATVVSVIARAVDLPQFNILSI